MNGKTLMACGLAVAFSVSAGGQAQNMDILLDNISDKIKSSFEYKNWGASVVTTITDLDKDGNAEKVIVVTKTVRSLDGIQEEEILKALETRKGKTKDVTQKYAQEAQKRRARQKQAEDKKDEDRKDSTIGLNELLPFSAERRNSFMFHLREGQRVSGREALALEVRAKVKDRKNWEGMFYVDAVRYDLLRVELRPSKNPRFVEEMEMKLDFELLDGRHSVLKKSWFKVEGGILFLKHIRMVVEDVYADFKIQD